MNAYLWQLPIEISSQRAAAETEHGEFHRCVREIRDLLIANREKCERTQHRLVMLATEMIQIHRRRALLLLIL
jgi:hypothetical protein